MAGFEHGIVYGMIYGFLRTTGMPPAQAAVEALREADAACAVKERMRPSYPSDPGRASAPDQPAPAASTPVATNHETLPIPDGANPLPGVKDKLRDLIGSWSPQEVTSFAEELIHAERKKAAR